MRAAASFEAMPPLPTPDRLAPARSSSTASMRATSSMSVAEASRRGSAVSSPSVSVSRTSRSAPTRLATSAASRSLSPKRISSSATASFSLTTATTPSASSAARVSRACRYCPRCEKSRGASSTWPTARPTAEKASRQADIRRGWPTADTAWRVWASWGRGRPAPTSAQPAVIAPEVTTTTDQPAARAAATSRGQRGEDRGVDAAGVVGHRRRADLDDGATRGHARPASAAAGPRPGAPPTRRRATTRRSARPRSPGRRRPPRRG